MKQSQEDREKAQGSVVFELVEPEKQAPIVMQREIVDMKTCTLEQYKAQLEHFGVVQPKDDSKGTVATQEGLKRNVHVELTSRADALFKAVLRDAKLPSMIQAKTTAVKDVSSESTPRFTATNG